MMNHLFRIYKNANKQLKVVFWFTFVGFLQKGISIITTPIFTRILSTEDYGLFSVFHAYYAVLVTVATLSLHMGVINNAFVKMPASNEKVVSAFQSLSLVISGSCFFIAVYFRHQLASLMGLPVSIVIVLFASFIFVEPYLLWVVYKRYQFDYVRPVVTAIIIAVLTPLISVAAVMLAKDYRGIVRIVSYAIVNIVLPGMVFYFINYRKSWTFYHKQLWTYALTFNIPLLAHYLSETLLNQTDRIMINGFQGSGAAGVYSVAYAVTSLFSIFSSALNAAVVPWTYQKLKEKDYKSIEKIGYGILILLAVVLSVIIMFAPEVIGILAGDKYQEAVFLIPTLSASVYFGYMYQLFSRIELYYEKKAGTVIATMTAAVVNILLNAWWIPLFGFQAAGYSTLIAHILFCMMHYFFYKKIVRENIQSQGVYQFRYLLLISLAVLGTAFVMTLLYDFLYLRLFVIFLIGVLGFALRSEIREFIRTVW